MNALKIRNLKKGHVYICRHGETTANIEERIIGNCEIPLTRKGIDEANFLAKRLQYSNLDLIISSPLMRAFETAQRIHTKIEYSDLNINQSIRPQSFGILEGLTLPEAKLAGYENFLHKLNTDKYTHFVPEGETAEEVEARTIPFYSDCVLLAKKKDISILLVTHNSVVRTIIGYEQKFSPKEWTSITIPNCAIWSGKRVAT
jgi:broad specificity phosphatase PhoE